MGFAVHRRLPADGAPMTAPHEYIPNGWTRGAAIQYAMTEQAKAEGVCAIIRPYHKTPEGAAKELVLPTIGLHDAWKHWWFSGPVVPAAINFPTPAREDERLRTNDSRLGPTVFRMPAEGTWAEFEVVHDPQAKAQFGGSGRAVRVVGGPQQNPFASPAPSAKSVNPFDNKPKNPWSK